MMELIFILMFMILLSNLFLMESKSFSYLLELLSLKFFLLIFFTFYFFLGGEFYFIFLLSLNFSFLVILIFYWMFKVF